MGHLCMAGNILLPGVEVSDNKLPARGGNPES